MQQEGKTIWALQLLTYYKVTSVRITSCKRGLCRGNCGSNAGFHLFDDHCQPRAPLSRKGATDSNCRRANVDAVKNQVSFPGQLTNCQNQHEQTLGLKLAHRGHWSSSPLTVRPFERFVLLPQQHTAFIL